MEYFLFSASQLKKQKEIADTLGKTYSPGTVLVGGQYKQFTEKVTDLKKAKFSDYIIVTQGPKGTIKYIGGYR